MATPCSGTRTIFLLKLLLVLSFVGISTSLCNVMQTEHSFCNSYYNICLTPSQRVRLVQPKPVCKACPSNQTLFNALKKIIKRIYSDQRRTVSDERYFSDWMASKVSVNNHQVLSKHRNTHARQQNILNTQGFHPSHQNIPASIFRGHHYQTDRKHFSTSSSTLGTKGSRSFLVNETGSKSRTSDLNLSELSVRDLHLIFQNLFLNNPYIFEYVSSVMQNIQSNTKSGSKNHNVANEFKGGNYKNSPNNIMVPLSGIHHPDITPTATTTHHNMQQLPNAETGSDNTYEADLLTSKLNSELQSISSQLLLESTGGESSSNIGVSSAKLTDQQLSSSSESTFEGKSLMHSKQIMELNSELSSSKVSSNSAEQNNSSSAVVISVNVPSISAGQSISPNINSASNVKSLINSGQQISLNKGVTYSASHEESSKLTGQLFSSNVKQLSSHISASNHSSSSINTHSDSTKLSDKSSIQNSKFTSSGIFSMVSAENISGTKSVENLTLQKASDSSSSSSTKTEGQTSMSTQVRNSATKHSSVTASSEDSSAHKSSGGSSFSSQSTSLTNSGISSNSVSAGSSAMSSANSLSNKYSTGKLSYNSASKESSLTASEVASNSHSSSSTSSRGSSQSTTLLNSELSDNASSRLTVNGQYSSSASLESANLSSKQISQSSLNKVSSSSSASSSSNTASSISSKDLSLFSKSKSSLDSDISSGKISSGFTSNGQYSSASSTSSSAASSAGESFKKSSSEQLSSSSLNKESLSSGSTASSSSNLGLSLQSKSQLESGISSGIQSSKKSLLEQSSSSLLNRASAAASTASSSSKSTSSSESSSSLHSTSLSNSGISSGKLSSGFTSATSSSSAAAMASSAKSSSKISSMEKLSSSLLNKASSTTKIGSSSSDSRSSKSRNDSQFSKLQLSSFYGFRKITLPVKTEPMQCLETLRSVQKTCERYCETNYGGDWVVIQLRYRQTSGITFDKPWNDYVVGFGDWMRGYWMGLKCLHYITKNPYELIVELTDADGQVAVAHYVGFSVGSAETDYKLNTGKFMGGSAKDSLRNINGRKFTTADKDNDIYANGNCAKKHEGGWWFKSCQRYDVKNFLNGYFTLVSDNARNFGVRWETWKTKRVIIATRLLIREYLPDGRTPTGSTSMSTQRISSYSSGRTSKSGYLGISTNSFQEQQSEISKSASDGMSTNSFSQEKSGSLSSSLSNTASSVSLSKSLSISKSQREIWEQALMYQYQTRRVFLSKSTVHDQCQATSAHKTCIRFCDTNYGDDWFVVQSRKNGSGVDFKKPWLDYVNGFGRSSSAYWMGLKCLHAITKTPHEILIQLFDAGGFSAVAHYSAISVGSAFTGYQVNIGKFLGGSAGDSLHVISGRRFTTYDSDSDGSVTNNCANVHKGGWWFGNCRPTSVKNVLNGYFQDTLEDYGVRWGSWNTKHTIVETKILLRRVPLSSLSSATPRGGPSTGSSSSPSRFSVSSTKNPYSNARSSMYPSPPFRFSVSSTKNPYSNARSSMYPSPPSRFSVSSTKNPYSNARSSMYPPPPSRFSVSSTYKKSPKTTNSAGLNSSSSRFSVSSTILGSGTSAGLSAMAISTSKSSSSSSSSSQQQYLKSLATSSKQSTSKYSTQTSGRYSQSSHFWKKVYQTKTITSSDSSGDDPQSCHVHIKRPNAICERYCDDVNYEGGWLVIQRRDNKTTNSFNQPWKNFVEGFGNWKEGYWMGLECIHLITAKTPHELLVELTDARGRKSVAHYSGFAVGPAESKFRLTYQTFLGGAADDSLYQIKGKGFSTLDNDNDLTPGVNCAAMQDGGWWYEKCEAYSVNSNLNSRLTDRAHINAGVGWQTWTTGDPIVRTKMLIRKPL